MFNSFILPRLKKNTIVILTDDKNHFQIVNVKNNNKAAF